MFLKILEKTNKKVSPRKSRIIFFLGEFQNYFGKWQNRKTFRILIKP